MAWSSILLTPFCFHAVARNWEQTKFIYGFSVSYKMIFDAMNKGIGGLTSLLQNLCSLKFYKTHYLTV